MKILAGALIFLWFLIFVPGVEGQVWVLEEGQPAPATGVLLDEETAIRAAAALNKLDVLEKELVLLRAKQLNSDERIDNLTALIETQNRLIEQTTESLVEYRQALAKSTAQNDRTLELLEKVNKRLEAEGKKTAWDYIWGGIKIIGAIIPFLLLVP